MILNRYFRAKSRKFHEMRLAGGVVTIGDFSLLELGNYQWFSVRECFT